MPPFDFAPDRPCAGEAENRRLTAVKSLRGLSRVGRPFSVRAENLQQTEPQASNPSRRAKLSRALERHCLCTQGAALRLKRVPQWLTKVQAYAILWAIGLGSLQEQRRGGR